MSHKGIFEDSDEDFTESESGEDFSASEDDWKPGKEDVSDEDDDDIVASSTDNDSSDDENAEKKSKKSKIKSTKKISKVPKLNASSNRRPTASLRSKLFRRYNPPPKSVSKSPVPSKVADILSNSQFKQRKQMASTSGSEQASAVQSDSGSSDEDGLVNPNEIDFKTIDVKAKQSNNQEQQRNNVPVFDCNAGMNLSDSSDEDSDEFTEVSPESNEEPNKKPSIVDKINKVSSHEMHDFSSLQDFAKNLESAKAHLEKLKENEANTSKTDKIDIKKLLSLGEGASAKTLNTPNRKRRHKDEQQSDDSDWENVSDNDEHVEANKIRDIQITIGNEPTRGMSREQKRAVDLEACLKRRLNRDIKEKQVYLHKTSVLCWIAHGNYINRILNNMTLMEMCLKLLPSKNAYPKGDTDVKYYHMVTDWFHTIFDLKSTKLYCELKRLPAKTLSLALQIQSRKIISKCDFVLLFVTLLRSLGIQCRLVINIAAIPQRPPQKDLFVISTKPKEEESKTTSKSEAKGTKTLAKKVKVSTEKMKEPFKEKPSKSTKAIEKPSQSKTSTASKAKKQEEHSYAESPKTKNFKIKIPRMSESFIERNTAEPTQSSSSKNSPKSPLIISKKAKIESSSNNLSNSNHQISPKLSSNVKKATKLKEIDNAVPSTSQSKSKRANTKQSIESNQMLIGTPIKNKLIERTNSIDIPSNRLKNKSAAESKVSTFSPRKTRSKSVMNGDTTATIASKVKSKLKLPQLDGADDIPQKAKKRTKVKAQPKKDDGSNSDSDFAPSPPKRIRTKTTMAKPVNKLLNKAKQIDRRVFSTDEEFEEDLNTVHMNFWVEAYAEKEKKWITIDPVKKKVDCMDYVKKNASKPIIYVLAWNNDNTIRDVTPRYCSQFHTTTRKLRAEKLWIDEALVNFIERRNPRTIIEDVEFSKLHMDTPMPTSINEFKNHPLYALERHLLKFEALYPPNPLTLGYIRKEPIYSRDCVHQLHSREIWVKQARTVKIGENPYKIVKARPKWNRLLNQMEEAKPLEIFGIWQTEPYKPPVAENGVVPRNPYGNVELFKPEMLPIGTRHLQLPNLNRVCKKMGVDCAQAVIGFDFHGGSSHPTFDGFVVCEEFADDVIKQWEIDQEEQIRKETEKREARVYGNWKKLIKGLLIRERLKRKFNFGVVEKPEKPEKITTKKGKKG